MIKFGQAQGAQGHRVGLLPTSGYGKTGTLIPFSGAGRASSLSAVCPLTGISGRKPIVAGVSELVPFPYHCVPLAFCLVFPCRPTFLVAHSLYGLEYQGALLFVGACLFSPNKYPVCYQDERTP